jgi:hypothetical protein
MALWIDALCINQNDVVEKGIQVPLMGTIYSNARSVLIWLGPEADESNLYFDFCNGTSLGSDYALSRYLEGVDCEATTPISAAIASLQRRTYWTRTWIIQEIVLAYEIRIFCGDRVTPWSNVRSYARK